MPVPARWPCRRARGGASGMLVILVSLLALGAVLRRAAGG